MSSNAFSQIERDENRREEQLELARDERLRHSRHQVTVTWIPVADEYPDAEAVVLASISGGSEPVWPAFTDGSDWYDASTGEELTGTVTHWCQFPMGVTP